MSSRYACDLKIFVGVLGQTALAVLCDRVGYLEPLTVEVLVDGIERHRAGSIGSAYSCVHYVSGSKRELAKTGSQLLSAVKLTHAINEPEGVISKYNSLNCSSFLQVNIKCYLEICNSSISDI
jgi:hypothetical protein